MSWQVALLILISPSVGLEIVSYVILVLSLTVLLNFLSQSATVQQCTVQCPKKPRMKTNKIQE